MISNSSFEYADLFHRIVICAIFPNYKRTLRIHYADFPNDSESNNQWGSTHSTLELNHIYRGFCQGWRITRPKARVLISSFHIPYRHFIVTLYSRYNPRRFFGMPNNFPYSSGYKHEVLILSYRYIWQFKRKKINVQCGWRIDVIGNLNLKSIHVW